MAFIEIDGLDVWNNPRTWESTTVSKDRIITPDDGDTVRVRVNEATHELAYEDESESGVTIVVKPKGERV